MSRNIGNNKKYDSLMLDWNLLSHIYPIAQVFNSVLVTY